MKFKINDKIQFIDLAKHIKPSKSYNVTILEAKVRETGFTEKQLEQLGKILEVALAPINKRLDKIETDIAEIRQDIKEMKSTPTMQKELAELKKKK